MTVSVEVLAVRETPPQLNAMLAVVEACKMAGTSYPPEASEFFGDALKIHGPDAVKLRAALESVQLPVTGDLMSDEGLLIDLENIPHDVATLRVRALDGHAIGSAITPPAEPDELDFPMEIDDPMDLDDPVDMDDSDDDFMVVGEEPVNIAEADTSLQLDGLASSEEEESDDVMDEAPAEEETGDTVIMRGDPLDIVDDFDSPLTLEEPEVPEAPMARPVYAEQQASPVVPEVPPPAQRVSPAPPPSVDEIDDLVLAVEDDLLDLDDLDKPLEFDTPAPTPSVDIDDPVAAVEDDLLDLGDFEETPHPNPNAPPLPPPRRRPPGQ